MPIILALGRLRWEDELKASLGNMAKPCLKTPSLYKKPRYPQGDTGSACPTYRGTSAGTVGRGTK